MSVAPSREDILRERAFGNGYDAGRAQAFGEMQQTIDRGMRPADSASSDSTDQPLPVRTCDGVHDHDAHDWTGDEGWYYFCPGQGSDDTEGTDFFEEDEPVKNVTEAYDIGEKGVTARPTTATIGGSAFHPVSNNPQPAEGQSSATPIVDGIRDRFLNLGELPNAGEVKFLFSVLGAAEMARDAFKRAAEDLAAPYDGPSHDPEAMMRHRCNLGEAAPLGTLPCVIHGRVHTYEEIARGRADDDASDGDNVLMEGINPEGVILEEGTTATVYASREQLAEASDDVGADLFGADTALADLLVNHFGYNGVDRDNIIEAVKRAGWRPADSAGVELRRELERTKTAVSRAGDGT